MQAEFSFKEGVPLYQPIPEFVEHLKQELGTHRTVGPLLQPHDSSQTAYFYQNKWLEPFKLTFASIGEAAKALSSIQRNWSHIPFASIRRGHLIEDKLPPLRQKAISFPTQLNSNPIGSFTLLDDNTLIGSAICTSPFPRGIANLLEDKVNPPSRAYLKLQEALLRLGHMPDATSRCLELGASPGGWTYVLAVTLGATVVAIDRAPLREDLMRNPRITFMEGDAFALKPADVPAIDWLFSDVICYPAKLLECVKLWITSGAVKHIVATIKFQGDTDFATLTMFTKIPHAQVLHLHHNKHELTFLWQRPEPP